MSDSTPHNISSEQIVPFPTDTGSMMIPFYVLGLYLLGRAVFLRSYEFSLGLKFNTLACILMFTQYHFASFYLMYIAFNTLVAVYLFFNGKGRTTYTAYLLCAIAHSVFHDEFMIQENILFNATVDYLLHAIMYILVSESYKSPKITRFLAIVMIVNVIVGFSSLEFKYNYDHCNEMIFGLPPGQPLTDGCAYWIGGYGAVSTVVVAVAAISGMICVGDEVGSPDTLFLEMLPYFLTSTSFYFVTDPMWVTWLYDTIKYDQFYFVLPIGYHLLTNAASSVKKSTFMQSSEFPLLTVQV